MKNTNRAYRAFILHPVLDIQHTMFLVDVAFLNLGLVPRSHYSPDVFGSLDACLGTLSDEDRRKANRKFRKVVRKCKWKKDSKADFHKKQRAVYYYVLKNFIHHKDPDNDE